MFLLFGVRIANDLLATLVYGCDRCGQNAAHHLMKRTRKITLFFVPLFPLSTRYVDTCTHCGRVLDVPREQAEAALTQRRPARAR